MNLLGVAYTYRPTAPIIPIVFAVLVLPASDGFLRPASFHRELSMGVLQRCSVVCHSISTNERFESKNETSDREDWETINRAVAYWANAAASNDGKNDSNVFFQLGAALSKRLDCYEEKQTSNLLSSQTVEQELNKIVASFENAVRIERMSIAEGRSRANLISVLRALGLVYMRRGQHEACLSTVDETQRQVLLKMPFAVEDMTKEHPSPEFDWIRSVRDEAHVALRTIGDPIFDSDVIDVVRTSSQQYRERPRQSKSTRFTMQFPGNSDIHLADLCSKNPRLQAAIDDVLVTKVYPLVRASFGLEGVGVPETPLCVYDALVVRYDADEAKRRGRPGASLPLHCDGGLVSVNVALNSLRNDTTSDEVGFLGGGTFFDSLIDNDFGVQSAIQRPLSAGHAVLHRSTERHAGAMTTSGIREILVVFISARQDAKLSNASGVERAFYLKEMAKQSSTRSVRLGCYNLALLQNPLDSEAQFWLGFYMIFGGNNSDSSQCRCHEIKQGITHLESAATLSPFNAQLFVYLGMAYSIRWNYGRQNGLQDGFPCEEKEMEKSACALKRAIQLESVYKEVDCNDDMDVATARLTLGEIFLRKNEPRVALEYLKQIEEKTPGRSGNVVSNIREAANSLMEKCKGELDA